MRMWMVEPKLLCRQHLLGEHVELHMLVGCIRKGRINSIRGLAKKGFVDTSKIQERHDQIIKEMEKRGYHHNSSLNYNDQLSLGKVDVERSRQDLMDRCDKCFLENG